MHYRPPQIEGPPQATYVDPAELSAERRDKGKADSIETWVVSVRHYQPLLSDLRATLTDRRRTLVIRSSMARRRRQKARSASATVPSSLPANPARCVSVASANGWCSRARGQRADVVPGTLSLVSRQNPIQQHPIDEVEAVSLSGKDVTLDLPALGGRPWAFHCASASEAEAVHAKLHASKEASGGSFTASAGRDAAGDSEDDQAGGLSVNTGGASSATKAVRWAPSPTSPAAAAPASDDDEEVAVALYDFSAEGGADELVLTEGERLVVVDKSGDGWWKVRNSQGEEGVVPEAYVELGAGGAAEDNDYQRQDEERAAAAEAEAAAIAAANAERAEAEAERRRQMEERRARQEAEEKRRRKEEESARRDEEARQCVSFQPVLQ